MAVKTTFTKQQLNTLLEPYNLGELITAEPFAEGTVHTIYALTTTKGKFVFKYYENRTVQTVAFELQLIKFLTQHNYPCAALFQDKNGNLFHQFNNKPYCIFEFIEGYHIEKPNQEQRHQIIEQIAKLHLLTAGYKEKNEWNYTPETCLAFAKVKTKNLNDENAKRKFAWLTHEIAKLEIPPTLPQGICHCDFSFSNILFEKGTFHALFDFDQANNTTLIYDIAAFIHPFISTFEWDTWQSFDKKTNVIDFTSSCSIIAEYQKYRALNEEEKRHLFDVVKLTILFDCVWYFDRGNAEDFFEKRKIEYIEAVGREQFYEVLF
jgi:homoserine kinase type II